MTKDISLKAACADTFHYPPDWDPKQGSLDQFQRRRGFEHHFGKSRTKNLHKGILVIRFELAFAVQCLRCSTYIGQGTRYDADKKKVGNYFSTPIYEFQMRCGCIVDPAKSADGGVHCNQRFVIRTDPKNSDYELVEGLRRKVQTWDPKSSGTIELPDPETRHKMDTDPMFRAEKTIRDAQRERSEKERLADLEDLQALREDTYALNSLLRVGNRKRRREEEAARAAPKPNFAVPLQPPSAEDDEEVATVVFKTDHDKVETAARRAAAQAAPIFRQRAGAKGQGSASNMADLVARRKRLAQHARMAQLFCKEAR